MTQRTLLVPLAVALLGAAIPAAPARADLLTLVRGAPPTTTTVILLDRSGSIAPADCDLQRHSLQSAGRSLRAGDRLMVADIGDGGAGDFRPSFDLRVPASNVRLRREAAEREARGAVEKHLPALLEPEASRKARSTRIIEAIAAAAPALARTNGHVSRLVIVSDAVEESGIINLARSPATPADTQAALRKARALGLLPDLRGVELHFAGAGGTHYGANKAFWAAYAAQTGGRIVAYGRLPFETAEAGR